MSDISSSTIRREGVKKWVLVRNHRPGKNRSNQEEGSTWQKLVVYRQG